MIECDLCGKENQDHYKFCLGCGNALEPSASPERSSQVRPPDRAASPSPVGSPQAEPPPLLAGDLEASLGLRSGKRAATYRAVFRPTGEEVFVKALAQALVGDSVQAVRFRREPELTRRLAEHGCSVVPVLSEGLTDDGRPYFVQPWLTGWSLSAAMRRRAVAEGSLALELVAASLERLSELHARDVVHGDVSPENLFVIANSQASLDGLGAGWSIRLVDLECARRLHGPENGPGALVEGKAPYLAPELAAGAPMSPASDLWAVGVVLHELLTGHRPWEAATFEDVPGAIKAGLQPVGLTHGVPDLVEELLQSILQPDPVRRAGDARSVALQLRRFAALTRWGRAPIASIQAAELGEQAIRVPGIRVVCTAPGRPPSVVEIAKREITLGRARQCDVVLASVGVSRLHARIGRRGDQVVLLDLNSSNGTLVNGRPVRAPAALGPGDAVRIGEFVLQATAVEVREQASDRQMVVAPQAGAASADDPTRMMVLPQEPRPVAGASSQRREIITTSVPAAARRPPAPPPQEDEGRREEVTTMRGLVGLPSNEDDDDAPAHAAVQFSVLVPEVQAGAAFAIEVWAFVPRDRLRYLAMPVRPAASRGEPSATSVELALALELPGFGVHEPEAVLHWDHASVGALLHLQAPAVLPPGPCAGIVTVLQDGLLRARLPFELMHSAAARSPFAPPPVRELQVRRAFASYASKDRDEVVRRVQGISAAGVDVFLDVASLRAGQDWKRVLAEEGRSRDVLYLFWSRHARESEWVEWEWRSALEHGGLDRIYPVPLMDPSEVPPPEELASLHFNDIYLRLLSKPKSGGLGRLLGNLNPFKR